MNLINLMLCLATVLPAIGTREHVGEKDGVQIEVVVDSPSNQTTPLQIICLFEYKEGDIFVSPPALPKELNGLVHVNDALHGLILELRKSRQFQGKFLETLLITSPPDTIKADKLLMIGLGNRNDFKPEMMQMVGVTGMREALRLNVDKYAHASDLKDSGFDSPTSDIAGFVVTGAIRAFRTQGNLYKENASAPLTVGEITILSGPSFFDDTKKGIKKSLEGL